MALETLKSETLRKIGRNVMLFQQMGHLLKYLLANGELSGHTSELKTNIEQQTATINKKTMGQVASQFLENTFLASEKTTNEPKEIKGAWISFRHTIECDDDYYQERKNN